MGRSRLDLSSVLRALTPHVYFQPPENVQMQYPAIVYVPDYENKLHANNGSYSIVDRYQVTIIDPDPDSELRKRFRQLPMCSYDRAYRSNGLNHFVYSLNY